MKQLILDLDKLLQTLNGNRMVFRNALYVFLKNFDDYLLTISKAIKENDWDSAREAAHKIKPNITIVGASDLELLTNQLHQHFIDPKDENTHQTYRTFYLCQTEYSRIKKHILKEIQHE